MINSIIQIKLTVLNSFKICHSCKEHLWKERKSKAQGIILYLSSGFQTMICMYAYLFLMQKAHPNLPLLTPLEFTFSDVWVGRGLLWPRGQPKPCGMGWAELLPGSCWVYGCRCGSAHLQGPEEQGFACCSMKHGRAGDGCVIRNLNHCRNLGQYRPPLIKYVPNLKHNFQLELIICSTCMYSLC